MSLLLHTIPNQDCGSGFPVRLFHQTADTRSRDAMLLGNLRQAQPGAAGLNDLLTIAHRAWEKESPQHVNDAPGLTLATERAWTEDMKSIYTDPVVIRFVRQRMNPGDDPFPTPR